MENSRRAFLQRAVAAVAVPQMAADPFIHAVLLGDSTFDNGAYTGGRPDVVAHLRNRLPPGSSATLLARDGATTAGMPAQLARLPNDATHLVVSVGGNDALTQRRLLAAAATSVAGAVGMLVDAAEGFEAAYRRVIDACLARRLPLVICTIYNGNFGDGQYQRLVRMAIALFDDAILRCATEQRLRVIDLRLVCSRSEDYANAIEPSSTGAARIARAIANALAGPTDPPAAAVYAA